MTEFLSFIIGIFTGAWIAWHFWLKRERPKVQIVIDPAILAEINGKIVTLWLDQRGLIWQPKGADFKPKAKL